MMRPSFSYYGGKQKLAEKIISLMPSHKVFVDAFAGSGAILFAKSPSRVEVYNDVNGDVCNFYAVVRDEKKARKLKRMVETTPYGRETYYEMVDRFRSDEYRKRKIGDLERAYIYYTLVQHSFGYMPARGFSYGVAQSMARKYNDVAAERLLNVCRRLNNVQIENLSYVDVIKKYDSKDTLFHFDPPYLDITRSEKNVYKNEMSSLPEHYRFISIISSIKGMSIISGYRSALYVYFLEKKFKFNRFDMKTRLTFASAGRGRKLEEGSVKHLREIRTECVWVSPNCEKKGFFD